MDHRFILFFYPIPLFRSVTQRMGTEMSILVADRLQLSRMRLAAGNPLFPEWKDLGGDPAQLPVATLFDVYDGTDPLSPEREGLRGTHKQHCLLDSIFSFYGLVGSEEPGSCIRSCYTGNSFVIHSFIFHLFDHFKDGLAFPFSHSFGHPFSYSFGHSCDLLILVVTFASCD